MTWRRRNVGPIGIDFGSRAVRMMQVALSGGRPEICAAGEFVYPAGAADRFDFSDAEAEYRYIPVGTVGSGDDSQMEIAGLGSPGPAIRRHLERLSKLGLTAEALDVVPRAVFRPFERFLRRGEDADQVNAFVDPGDSG